MFLSESVMRGKEGGGGEGRGRVRGRTLHPFVHCSLQPYSFATRKLLLFVDLNNKLNDPIVGSVFNNIHSRGQILYMEVSSEHKLQINNREKASLIR